VIATSEYAHNFLEPGTVRFPDRTFPFTGKTQYTPLSGVAEGKAEVENSVRLEIRESGPIAGRGVFLSPRSVSPEFFRKIVLKPGESVSWKRSYTVSRKFGRPFGSDEKGE